MSKLIVVNNPAAKEGGVLTILKEFLEKTSKLKCNRKFLVFVSLEELKKYEASNLVVEVIPKQSFKDRIIWDNLEIKKYLKKERINPDIFISLQNTGVNISKKIPQIIYYQQPLSLSDLKWNIFNKQERLYWMYKNIYPFFIKQYLGRIKKVIVQTEWVKDEFNKRFNYSKENIILIRPEIKKIDVDSIKIIYKDKFRIFYPATPYIYKNHKVVIEALGILKRENPEIIEKLECVFTFSKGENLELDNLIEQLKLQNVIKLIGKIPYEKVLEYYKNSDLLVFPSCLETYGLPLAEAQQFDLDILGVDLPYSREVVGNYSKSKFIKSNCLDTWKKMILCNYDKKME